MSEEATMTFDEWVDWQRQQGLFMRPPLGEMTDAQLKVVKSAMRAAWEAGQLNKSKEVIL